MIEEIIKIQNNPNIRHVQYIVKMTETEKVFREVTSLIFDVPLKQCARKY